MATLQQIQEAARLKREKNLTPAQAVEQVRATATPITPPVTPTQNFPSQPLNQQTTTGVNWETFQVAPVNQQGITPQAPQSVAPIQPVSPNTPPPTQNVTPTITPTATPEKKAVVPQVDFNLSQGREWEIQKNVADITATNPTLLKDRNAYNQAFGYETADQWKKAILDSAFQSGQPQVPNADMMFSSIVMKAPVADDQKTTTQYKIAQNRYLKANSYASMTPAQVSSDITSGKLIEWSQTYEDIKALNPKLIQDTNNLRIVNGSKVSLYSTDAQWNKVNNVKQSFTEDYLGNFGTFLKSLFTVQTPEQIRSVIYTDDVQQAQDKATSIELELNQIEADQAKMEEITRKELEWTGASAERIRLEVGIKQDKLTNQYNSKLKEYNTYANKANNLITQNTTVYQEQMKQTTAQQQALAGAAGQVFAKELELQQNQAEFDQKIAQQAQAMWTPELAIPEVINQYAQLGIMASKSAQQHVADAKAFIARGGTLGQYISQMQKDFQAKPEYQAKFAPKATENFELKEVWGKTYRFNQATGEYEVISPISAWTGGDLRYLAGQFPWQAWAKNNNPAWITWNANFDKWTGTAKLFADAGIQFSKGTARPANEGGNYVTFATIEDWLKAQQIIMTQTYGNKTVWEMLSSWVGTSEWPNYAKQVAWMAWVDQSVKVSSLSPEQLSTLQMAKIKKESPGLYWILSQGTPQKEAKVLNDNDIALLGSVEKLDKQGKETLKENGYTEQDWANFKAGLLPPTSNQKKQASDVVKQIEDMLAWDALSDAVGMAKTPWAIPWTQRKDFEAKFATFRDSLALSNIDKLKWAMSDKDIEFLRNTASSLNLDMSEAEFIKQLNAVKQKYDNIAQWMPVNATQTTQTSAWQTNSGAWVTYSYGWKTITLNWGY